MKKFILILVCCILVLTFSCKKEDSTNYNEILFTQYRNLPIISVTINGKEAKLLVDTGATENMLNLSSKSYYNFSTRETGRKVNGVGGFKYIEEVYNANIKYKDSVISIDFVAIDMNTIKEELGVQGLIGSSFLEKHGYSVNFKDNKIHK